MTSCKLYWRLQVRLMLVLAPAACCLAGVAVHEALVSLFRGIHSTRKDSAAPQQEMSAPVKPRKGAKGATKVRTATYPLVL